MRCVIFSEGASGGNAVMGAHNNKQKFDWCALNRPLTWIFRLTAITIRLTAITH